MIVGCRRVYILQCVAVCCSVLLPVIIFYETLRLWSWAVNIHIWHTSTTHRHKSRTNTSRTYMHASWNISDMTATCNILRHSSLAENAETCRSRCALAQVYCPQQHTLIHCNALSHSATHNTPPPRRCVAHFTTLQHTLIRCNTRYYSATHSTTLQHTLLHYNTPGVLPMNTGVEGGESACKLARRWGQ